MRKLAIITTHPIQYNAPWFRMLSKRNHCIVKVFYTWSQSKLSIKDRTFGKEIKWDIPLLDGYDFEFVKNVSKNPGSHHFFGIDCPSLNDDIATFQADAILIFGWKFKSHFRAMRHFSGKIPIWFRGDSTLIDDMQGWKSNVRRIILKKVYSYVDTAFYVGEASRDYFLKYHLKESQLVYAPHAIDNDRFKDDAIKQYELKAKDWRNRLNYDVDDIVVVFAGKFESKKQPLFLIDALIEANKSRILPLKLIMIGNGPLELEISEKIENNKNIQMLPFQNQTIMPIVYRLGDIFCLPSKGPGETWGLAVNEAMASSRPVILSNKVGCLRDMLVEGKNGYSFNYDNVNELIKIFDRLNKFELYEMRANAENHVLNFTMLKIVEAIEKNINGL